MEKGDSERLSVQNYGTRTIRATTLLRRIRERDERDYEGTGQWDCSTCYIHSEFPCMHTQHTLWKLRNGAIYSYILPSQRKTRIMTKNESKLIWIALLTWMKIISSIRQLLLSLAPRIRKLLTHGDRKHSCNRCTLHQLINQLPVVDEIPNFWSDNTIIIIK